MSKFPIAVGVSIRKIHIIQRMFMQTADNNYMMARMAYFNGVHLDFLWLASQSIEKYLKAILLHQGKSVSGYGHKIDKLYEDVSKEDSRISISLDDKIPMSSWVRREIERKGETVVEFVKRINYSGDPSNRYLTYGYDTGIEDLIKIDHLIWGIRRVCRIWKYSTKDDEGNYKNVDIIENLANDGHAWRHAPFLPVERAVSGLLGKETKRIFMRMNFPFGCRATTRVDLITVEESSPLTSLLLNIADPDPLSEKSQIAYEALQWMLANMTFSSPDKARIRSEVVAWEARRAAFGLKPL